MTPSVKRKRVKRNTMQTVRLTIEEKRMLEELAVRTGVSESDILRMLLRRRYDRDHKAA